ncbi:hypothetical protein KR026_003117, partial [Drosophila bipectinata]
ALRVIHLETEQNDEERRRQIAANKYGGFCVHVFIAAMLCIMLVVLFFAAPLGQDDMLGKTSAERMEHQRRYFEAKEARLRLGGRMEMSPLEEVANGRLMAVKMEDEEVHSLWKNYHSQPPPFLRNHNISETDLYGLLRSMPKGGLLHIHDSGMMKVDVLIGLTYRDNLWVCVNREQGFEDFRFSKTYPHVKPTVETEYQCTWMLLSNFFHYEDRSIYEAKLRECLLIKPEGYASSSDLSRHLRRAQRLIHGLVTYKPMWPNFLGTMLQDFHDDGVQYVELRSSLPILYDLEGSNYTILDTASAMVSAVKIFKSVYRDFIGIKLIYAPSRDFNDTRINQYLENARILKSHFPDFFAGFDLNTFGDECNLPLLGRATQLLNVGKDIDFYFHAGESKCPDSYRPDANLIDAFLLDSKRLGNSLNVPLHPEIMKALKSLQVAVELCPLSNHYLQYYNDFRQHPAAYLIAAGFPVVIGSDYPYFWNSAPLTNDFYVTFVGVVTGFNNLRVLKQLAVNSFLYSSLSHRERKMAMAKWQCSWNRWIMSFMNTTKQ